MDKLSTKEMFHILVKRYERLQIENWALMAILKTSPSEHTKQTWEADLKHFFSDPQLLARAHKQFAPLYAQIDAASEETVVAELLSQFRITGKPN